MPLHNVSDASELAKLIDDGVLEADRVVAVIGKTEGNGGVNDYTRILADRAFREVLTAKGSRGAAAVGEIPIVWSGGTDGVISPHATIFATVPSESAVASSEPRLSVGFAMSEVLLPEDIGRTAMITKVADAVKEAMGRAGITDPADVHYVQTKTPLLTIHTIQDAKSRGQTVWTRTPATRWICPTGVPRWGSLWRSARSRCRGMPMSCIAATWARRSPRARPAWSWTGRRWSWLGTCAGSVGIPDRTLGHAGRAGCRWDLGGDPGRRAGVAGAAALDLHGG